MHVDYRTGHIGPLLTTDDIPAVPSPGTVLITGDTPEAVHQAAKAVSTAVKKKRRKAVAKSRRANRK